MSLITVDAFNTLINFLSHAIYMKLHTQLKGTTQIGGTTIIIYTEDRQLVTLVHQTTIRVIQRLLVNQLNIVLRRI